MTRLYAYPFACSQAVHIAARIAGLPIDLEWVDMREKKLADGANYLDIAPKGKVPVLELDDGSRISETAAVLQWIADQSPSAQLAPAAGTRERYRLQELLHFISTELHKQIFFPLLRAPLTTDLIAADALSKFLLALLPEQLKQLQRHLGDSMYLMGDGYTVVDGYALVIFNWMRYIGYPLDKWPRLQAYSERLRAHPVVREVQAIERRVPNFFEATRPGVV
jgi:glutathione S-transferase